MRKFIVALLLGAFLFPVSTHAQLDGVDTGLETTGESAYNTSDVPSVGEFLGRNIIAPALGLLGIIFLVLMIYAGFLWMTAAGNSDQVSKAKRLMVNAIIGSVIIVGAYALTTAVFDAISGPDTQTETAA